MSLSSDRDDLIPISQCLEWSDIVSVLQTTSPNPVVPITYSGEFRETMDYFRDVCLTGELSHRALKLTSETISMNAGNYTV